MSSDPTSSEPNDVTEFAGAEAEGPHGYKRDRADPIKPPFRGFELLSAEQRGQVVDVREGRLTRCVVELPDERVLIEHVDAGYLIEETGTRWGYTARRVKRPRVAAAPLPTSEPAPLPPRAAPPVAAPPTVAPPPPPPPVRAAPAVAPIAATVVARPPPPPSPSPATLRPAALRVPTTHVQAAAPTADLHDVTVPLELADARAAPLVPPATAAVHPPALPVPLERRPEPPDGDRSDESDEVDASMTEELRLPDELGAAAHDRAVAEVDGRHGRHGSGQPASRERRHASGRPRTRASSSPSPLPSSGADTIWRPEQSPKPRPLDGDAGGVARAIVLWLLVVLMGVLCAVLIVR